MMPNVDPSKHATIFVAVDEGGNIGSVTDGGWYILCGCTVTDRKTFADATRRYRFGREMKFKKDVKHRYDVLEYALPAVSNVFYVAVRKNQERFSATEQHIIHTNALTRLADSILYSDRTAHMDVEIDHNSMVLDYVAESIFEDNPYAFGRDVKADVVSSDDSYEMQTHDFIVGAIGRYFNRSDDSYVGVIEPGKLNGVRTTSDIEKEAGMVNRVHMARADTSRRNDIASEEDKTSQGAVE